MSLPITELISLEDAMDELELGPNGGLVYCMEYLLDNMDWLKDELDKFDDDEYIIFDCPGQVLQQPCRHQFMFDRAARYASSLVMVMWAWKAVVESVYLSRNVGSASYCVAQDIHDPVVCATITSYTSMNAQSVLARVSSLGVCEFFVVYSSSHEVVLRKANLRQLSCIFSNGLVQTIVLLKSRVSGPTWATSLARSQIHVLACRSL